MKKSNKTKPQSEWSVPSFKSKKGVALILFSLMFFAFLKASAQTPILGMYKDTSVIAGQQVAINPSAAPINTTKTVAYTNSLFTGILTVNPTTGVINVTNAMQAGTYTLTVKATNGALSATTSFTLTVTNPKPSQGFFEVHSRTNVGYCQAIEVGDFNNDGIQDLVFGLNVAQQVLVKLGDGNGGFTGSTPFSANGGPEDIAVADFNGDGNMDLAIANQYRLVAIRLGDGLGGFSGNTNLIEPYTQATQYLETIAIGDFNNDHIQDMALGYVGFPNTISIRLGDGNGGFSASLNMPTQSIRPLAISDFNSDGNLDIASAGNAILYGDGMGGFITGAKIFNTYGEPHSGDFNGDGKPDMCRVSTVPYNNYNTAIFLNNNNGGFNKGNSLKTKGQVNPLSTGDFNGDGNLDFTYSEYSLGSVSLHFGDGNGNFAGGTETAVTPHIISSAVGDFNGDGNQDMVVNYNYTISEYAVLLGGASEPYSNSPCNINPTCFTDNSRGCNEGRIIVNLNSLFMIYGHLELYDASNTLIRTADVPVNKTRYVFRNIEPGEYTVKVFDNTYCEVDLIAYLKCAPPTSGFASTYITANSVQLNWDTLDCADGYRVDYREQGTTAWTQIGVKTNVGRKTINGLQPSTTYEWRVSTKCDQTNSFKHIDHSATQTFTTIPLRIGEEQIAESFDIGLYPNPASNNLVVSFESNIIKATLKVINTLGQTVIEKQLENETGNYDEQLDISRLQNGIYFLQIETETGIKRSRFIKN